MNTRNIIAIALISGLIIALTAGAVLADVFITEVYYDALNSSSYGEAVELFNNDSSSVDVTGWFLATESSETDLLFPPGATIPAHSHYLVTDLNWDENRDDVQWNLADYMETITMNNANSGIALINGSALVDAVGWGDVASIDTTQYGDLYQETPAEDATSGYSLQRISNNGTFQNTQDNANDFIVALPDLKNSSSYTGYISNGEIEVTVVVENVAPEILLVDSQEDLNNESEGIQIIPVENMMIDMLIYAEDNNGFDDLNHSFIEFLGLEIEEYSLEQIDNVTGVYLVDVPVSTILPAGPYDLSITVFDQITNNTFLSFIEILPVMALELSGSVALNLTPYSDAITTISIENTGNTDAELYIAGTDFGGEIPVHSMYYSLDNFETFSSLSYDSESTGLAINIGETGTLYLRLDLQQPVLPGSYTGSITIYGG